MSSSSTDLRDYTHLSGFPGDFLRGISTITQEKDSWILKSNLPTTIHVFVKRRNSDEMKKFTVIPPMKSLSFPPSTFNDFDEVHAYYIPHFSPDEFVMLMPPHTLRSFYKTITFGGVTYATEQGHNEFQRSGADLSGVWIENNLAIPLTVFYEGLPVVRLGMYDGLTYLGGSRSIVRFDGYNSNGLKYGDQLTFAYRNAEGVDMNLFTVTITDINCRRMSVGVITSGYEDPRKGYDTRYSVP